MSRTKIPASIISPTASCSRPVRRATPFSASAISASLLECPLLRRRPSSSSSRSCCSTSSARSGCIAANRCSSHGTSALASSKLKSRSAIMRV